MGPGIHVEDVEEDIPMEFEPGENKSIDLEKSKSKVGMYKSVYY